MTNLIPQLRADKNGKLVTRHVNTAPKQGAGKSIPQPKIASKPEPAVVDIMDQPTVMRAFIHGSGRDDVTAALKRDFDLDSDADAQVTSRQWYLAKGAGLNDVQLRHFLLAGFTKVEDMVEYAHENDRRFARSVPPGILARRKKWTDSCLNAGITMEKFKEADKNFGSYSIVNTMLEDFNLKGEPSDVVSLYADYAKSSRAVYMPYLWEGKIGFEQLKETGVKRLRQYDVWLSEKEADDFARVVEIIKSEEKSKSPFGDAKGRVAARVYFEARFGRERADQIVDVASMGTSGYELDQAFNGMNDDEAFAFAKFHDETQRMLLDQRDATNEEQQWLVTPDKSIAYHQRGLTPEETAHAIQNGHSPESARGIRAGMKSAVAEGWL